MSAERSKVAQIGVGANSPVRWAPSETADFIRNAAGTYFHESCT